MKALKIIIPFLLIWGAVHMCIRAFVDTGYERTKIQSESRDASWPRVRSVHLADHPECEACGSRKDLNVHHVEPFHIRPELELEPTNLITLCERCHLLFGHLCNYKSHNPNVVEDAQRFHKEVENRP